MEHPDSTRLAQRLLSTLILSGLILLLPVVASALDPCPTPPTKPARGVPCIDVETGLTVTRLSDHVADGIAGFVRNDYSRRQAFSADQTRVILYGGDGGYWYLYDAMTFAKIKRLSPGPGGDAEIQWHPTDPNLFYYMDNNGGLKIYVYNIVNDAIATVANFTGRLPWPTAARCYTGAEGSPSADGRYWAFMCKTNSFSMLGLMTYDLQTDTIIGTKTTAEGPNYVSMSPTGDYFIGAWWPTQILDGAGGRTRAYTRDLTSWTVIDCSINHADLALGADGHDYYIAVDFSSGGDATCSPANGYVFVRDIQAGFVSSGYAGGRRDITPTYIGGTTRSSHFSGKAFGMPGYVLKSTYGCKPNSGTCPKPIDDKVMLINIGDGSISYLAEMNNVTVDYWSEPHASISRDGTKAIFNSNWDGIGSADNDVDAYIVDFILASPPPPPQPDTTPPTVSMAAPAHGVTVSGTGVTIAANSSDNVGVAGVQFKLDGANLGVEDTSFPYSISWNTTLVTNGSHTLTAVARDAAGNQTSSASVSVTVANDVMAPVLSGVAASSMTGSGATIAWTTNEASNSQVEYGPTTAYGSLTTLNPSLVTAHSQALSGLAASTLYHYRVKSRDAAGNLAVSGDFTFTTLGARSPYKGVPFAVPGQFEAEDFDNGGEGVAYHDNIAGNAGGLYRATESVDIVSDGSTGYKVNNFETGEWLEYTINVTKTGTYRLEANVASEFTTASFSFKVDGVDVTGPIAAPNTGNWNTFQYAGKGGVAIGQGLHILQLFSTGQYVDVNSIRITEEVGPPSDTTPPTVSITAPANGATVSGTAVTVSATASDNVGVVGVQFKFDGAALGAEDTTASYAVLWNTTGVTNGSHTITAVARDAAGNTATSASISITVDNAAPLISAVSASAMSSTSATISWTTGEASNSQVEYGSTTAYGSVTAVNPSLVTAHSQALSGLAASTLYHYRVKSRDAAGNLAVSGDATFTTLAPPDTTPPSVSLTAPVSGATVAGTAVMLSASASDNVGVVGVQFKLDGTNLGTEGTSSPYSISWNTISVSNGTHTLTAVARDAAGNVATSAGVSVTVTNDAAAPVLSAVASSAIGSTAATITWTTNEASDSQVEYGPTTAYGSVTTLNPSLVAAHSQALSGLAASTLYHFRVKSRDAAGNLAVSGDGTFTTAPASPAGLVAAYSLNQGGGATALDTSGNGRQGTISGATWTSQGRYGAALSFDGVNDRVRASTVTLGAAFTLMAWIHNPTHAAYETILTVGTTRDLFLRNGVITFYDGAADRPFGNAIATNVWHHVALVSDGATLRVYLNGALLGTPRARSLGSVSGALQLGAWIQRTSNYDFFGGRIDEVRVYSRALTQAEVQTDMTTPIGP